MEYRSYKKKLHSIVLAFILVFFPVFHQTSGTVVGADTVSENKARQDELKKQNNELNSKLAELRDSVSEQRAYVDTINAQIKTVQEQIDLSNRQVYDLGKKIRQKEAEFSETNVRISKNLALLRQRIRAIYLAGETSTLDIILGARDFNDFIDKAEIVKTISKHDETLINQLKSDLEAIKSEKEAIEKDRITVAEEKKSLDAKKDELQKLYDESHEMLVKIEGEESSLLDQINENDSEMQKIQAEIDAYYAEQQRKAQEEEQKKNPSSTSSSSTSSSSGYTWPVPGYYYISSDYYDSYGRSSMHGAIDIAGSGIYGAPVVAAASGTVIQGSVGGWGGGYGTYLVIDHGNGKSTLYAHMSGAVAYVGQTVSKGQVIGYVGSTGYSTGPHLHFETRSYGRKYNPMNEF